MRRRQVNPRKVYPVDTGLIALFDRSGKANTGHALETVVWHELQRRGFEPSYVRTAAGLEVDFSVRSPAGDEALIQVCAELDDPATLAREVRALQDAAAASPQASLHLIVLDVPSGLQLPAGVQLNRAADWLLGQTWHSFFLDGPQAADDFMENRASQDQPEREAI